MTSAFSPVEVEAEQGLAWKGLEVFDYVRAKDCLAVFRMLKPIRGF